MSKRSFDNDTASLSQSVKKLRTMSIPSTSSTLKQEVVTQQQLHQIFRPSLPTNINDPRQHDLYIHKWMSIAASFTDGMTTSSQSQQLLYNPSSSSSTHSPSPSPSSTPEIETVDLNLNKYATWMDFIEMC